MLYMIKMDKLLHSQFNALASYDESMSRRRNRGWIPSIIVLIA